MERKNKAVVDMFSFWGKAHPHDPAADVRWHPIAYHLLDVAAVAEALLQVRPLTLATGARLLGLGHADTQRLLIALIALHDLGKFAPAFQAKAPEHWPAQVLGPYNEGWGVKPGHHTEDGYLLWPALVRGPLKRLHPSGLATLYPLAPAIFGHHGRPVGFASRTSTVAGRFQQPECEEAALACADLVLALLCPEPVAGPIPDTDRARRASWWVSGLTTVADWIGSNEHWFQPYVAPMPDDPTLGRYWSMAQKKAEVAVREAGIVTPRPAEEKSFVALTNSKWMPTPVQHWAETTALSDDSGPLLVIIEDVTGAGKTEAAQMLVHRLMATNRATGVYWAMPTQATANAMYERQARALHALFDEMGHKPSLVLAHGQQRLNQTFRATVLNSGMIDGRLSGTDPAALDESEELPSTATCAAWLADDRRAAMLADVGAGTVDQALLGILPSRFNTIRLFGLADKVLVIDEAHAYDSYMGVELEELLRFHAAFGGSAVVLSATLPRERRTSIIRAWEDGMLGGQRRLGVDVPLTSQSYPLASAVGRDGVHEDPLGAAPWSKRSLPVRLVHDLHVALRHVADAARGGAAVAWVRNTVDDCLAAAASLREMGIDPLVFHARFAQADRQNREQEVLESFGRNASDVERRGRVLVATQVVEQSLDLDFDAMVSDLAPIDLIVQRAGRLQRHSERIRPEGIHPELVVLAPAPDEHPTVNWLGGIFSGTGIVYANPGVLWRTVRAIDRVRAIITPGGLRDLIESVYGSDEVPPSLSEATYRAEGIARAQEAAGTYGTLKFPDGYNGNAQAWLSELRVPTRLGEEQTVVRLARVEGDNALEPWATDTKPEWKAWALSEVRLSGRRVPFDVTADRRFDIAVDAVRRTWGKFEQEIPVLPLERVKEEGWRGMLHHPSRARPIAVLYTKGQGLSYE